MRIKPKIYGLVTSDQAQNIVKVIKIIPQIEFSDLVITVKKDNRNHNRSKEAGLKVRCSPSCLQTKVKEAASCLKQTKAPLRRLPIFLLRVECWKAHEGGASPCLGQSGLLLEPTPIERSSAVSRTVKTKQLKHTNIVTYNSLVREVNLK